MPCLFLNFGRTYSRTESPDRKEGPIGTPKKVRKTRSWPLGSQVRKCIKKTGINSAKQTLWSEAETEALLLPLTPKILQLLNYSPPGSSVHGILQARILEWAVMPASRGSSPPRDRTYVSCIKGGLFTSEPPGKSTRRLTV